MFCNITSIVILEFSSARSSNKMENQRKYCFYFILQGRLNSSQDAPRAENILQITVPA